MPKKSDYSIAMNSISSQNSSDYYLPSCFWAPIQYFTKVLQAKKIILEQHENYVKQTYRNRCNIFTANGAMTLSVPVEKRHGEKTPIRDVRIDYSEHWQHTHWKALVAAYNSSPFFDYYICDLRPIYEHKEVFLFDLNEKTLRIALELIGLKTDIGYTDRFEQHYPCNDFRQSISPKTKGTDKTFKPQNYYQVFSPRHGFAANLSILDLLCNEGPNSISVLQSCITG